MTKEQIIEIATARQSAGPLNTGATPELIWDLIIELANLSGGGTTPTLAQVLTQGNSAGNKIINVTDPTSAQDAATRAYVLANVVAPIFPAGTKVYCALLTQTGTNAPVATVLGTNTIGSIVWAYGSAGFFTGTLSAAFPAGKTWLMISPVMTDPSSGVYTGFKFSRTSNDEITLETYFGTDNTNDQLSNQAILILVFP